MEKLTFKKLYYISNLDTALNDEALYKQLTIKKTKVDFSSF